MKKSLSGRGYSKTMKAQVQVIHAQNQAAGIWWNVRLSGDVTTFFLIVDSDKVLLGISNWTCTKYKVKFLIKAICKLDQLYVSLEY